MKKGGIGLPIVDYTKTDVVRAVTICAGAIGLHRPRHEALELAPDDVVESEADDADVDGGWLKLGRGKERRRFIAAVENRCESLCGTTASAANCWTGIECE